MNRSSVAIWKECLNNTGIPTRPDDLNEPQWADLAFGKHCQVSIALLVLVRWVLNL